MQNVKKAIFWRAAISFGLVALFAFLVAFKMFSLQLVEGKKWLAQADSVIIKEQKLNPPRGNIYSDNGSLLATSMPIYEIRFDPTVCRKDTFDLYIDELALRLSNFFPNTFSKSEVKNKIIQARRNKKRYLLLVRNVSFHQQKAMQSWPIFRLGKYKGGLIIEQETKRVWPASPFALRTIGYVTEHNPGVGLERSFNKALGGSQGKRLVQRISGGYRPIGEQALVAPKNGKDIHTTINLDFQEIVHQALAKGILNHSADHGCAIVMEVKTGAIKAISNLQNTAGGVVESYNYAIGESIEPGSVFKVFSAMALLEDKILNLEDSINIYNGFREFFGRPMRDSDAGKRKRATFLQAFALSSNVAFSSLIFDNYFKQPSRYIGYLKKLNLHEPTGIDILGEPHPKLNQPGTNSWSNLTLPWLAIGYENQHTALQMLTAYNAIANNGILLKPYLVQRITDAGKDDESHKLSKERVEVCSPETAQLLWKMGRATVKEGTASGINSPIVDLAGKTGTAQIAIRGNYQLEKQYNASFIGHFPAQDPTYAVIVVINKPAGGQFYASEVAAPVFKELAEKIYTIAVTKPLVVNAKPSFPATVKTKANTYNNLAEIFSWEMVDENDSWILAKNGKSHHTVSVSYSKMPNVAGMGPRDATYILEQLGVIAKVKGVGRVTEQSPAPGSKISNNQIVYLQLGK